MYQSKVNEWSKEVLGVGQGFKAQHTATCNLPFQPSLIPAPLTGNGPQTESSPNMGFPTVTLLPTSFISYFLGNTALTPGPLLLYLFTSYLKTSTLHITCTNTLGPVRSNVSSVSQQANDMLASWHWEQTPKTQVNFTWSSLVELKICLGEVGKVSLLQQSLI